MTTMITKSVTKVPAQGQAWSGNWQARLAARLRSRGFETMTAFAEANPNASLIAMAEELSTDHEAGIDRADLSSDQLVRIWHEEANRSGPEAVERFSRRMLVGELHRDLPEGWRADWSGTDPATEAVVSRAIAATTRWICNHGKKYRPAADRVFDAMVDEGRAGRIPIGWLPASADDVLLVDIFRRHWGEPK